MRKSLHSTAAHTVAVNKRKWRLRKHTVSMLCWELNINVINAKITTCFYFNQILTEQTLNPDV